MGNAVVHVVHRFFDDPLRVDVGEVHAGFAYQRANPFDVQRRSAAFFEDHLQSMWLDDAFLRALTLRPRPRPVFAIQDVVTRYLVFARSHEGEFHLILNVLDMQGAARREASFKRRGDLL